MTNRLIDETSPYLLQHAENPVDWYPWCEAALALARQQDKPIFLSIGYSACHWCHVMEHESFENQSIAATLNEHFVCIKVDREERPDLDQIYMQAVQMMTGRGGWPMSVFLTPDLQPFFGGTYWPPTARMGMPGFSDVLRAVIDAWQHRRLQAVEQAAKITEHIREVTLPQNEDAAFPSADTLMQAARQLEQSFDFAHGGFGQAPKFPHAADLELLLRVWHRTRRTGLLDMVRLTLDKMARGGIFDHLGGGFARYSVDERWLVPHFEKMLYDNALLATIYIDAFAATGEVAYAETARTTLDFVLREMTDPAGGFHSAFDADSEGVEGKYYVWTPAEIRSVLGDELGEQFCYVYDVTEVGNFEGHNILNMPKTWEQCVALRGGNVETLKREMHAARQQLLSVRSHRIPPAKDDKVLVNWNGLMIAAMAAGGAVLHEPRYLDAARRAAEFILQNMRRKDGRLYHSWRKGRARFDAYLDDYSHFANGLWSLYEATFEETWIDHAVDVVELMRRHFADRDRSGFFFTANDHETLIARQKDVTDASLPSGNGMAATVLARLGFLCGRADYLCQARETIDMAQGWLSKYPTAAGQLLIALDLVSGPTVEIAVLGDLQTSEVQQAVHALRGRYMPNKVVAVRSTSDVPNGSTRLDPLFQGRALGPDPPTVYVCQGFVCTAPRHGLTAALDTWESLSQRAW